MTLRPWTAGLATGVAVLMAGVTALAQPPLEQLPEILQLQLNQQPAWRAYRDAEAQNRADAAHEAGLAVQLNALTTPQRLTLLRDQLSAQRDGFEREAAATQAFYATLSPEQRHIFDDVTRLPTPRPPGGAGVRSSVGQAHDLRVPPSAAGLPPLAPGVRP